MVLNLIIVIQEIKEKNNLKQNGNINSNEKAYIENEEIDEQKPL